MNPDRVRYLLDRDTARQGFSGARGRQHAKVAPQVAINRINHLHFTNGCLQVHLRQVTSGEDVLVQALPGPCTGEELTVTWGGAPPDLVDYLVLDLVIDDGRRLMLIPVRLKVDEGLSMVVEIKGAGYLYGRRQATRYACAHTRARISQGSFTIQGELVDFAYGGFRIRLQDPGPLPPAGLDVLAPLRLSLANHGEEAYCGQCRYLRSDLVERDRVMVLQCGDGGRKGAPRRRRIIRNPRLCLSPVPKIIFRHPLTGREVQYEAVNVSHSGFMVEDDPRETLLFPGLQIRDVVILIANAVEVRCAARVLYVRPHRHKGVQVGFAITDMDILNCHTYFDILGNAYDGHANLKNVMKIENLWDFFFSTGFIYPSKYELISSYTDEFKKIYHKIYRGKQEIFFNSTYQHNGKIFGHLSIIRAYQRAMMLQHMAALPEMHGRKRIGLDVVQQVFFYFDAFHRYPSARVEYLMSFFRPTSSFNIYFLQGFCKRLQNLKGCSMDLFAYHLQRQSDEAVPLPEPWRVVECTLEDIDCLEKFYAARSGGLLLDALALRGQAAGEESLEDLYRRYGFTRSLELYSLFHGECLKAVILLDRSDLAINFSELLNTIKVLVIDEQDLAWDILQAALRPLAVCYGMDTVPLMVYPAQYLEHQGLDPGRQYWAWILNTRYADVFLQDMKRKIRITPVKIALRYVLARLGKT